MSVPVVYMLDVPISDSHFISPVVGDVTHDVDAVHKFQEEAYISSDCVNTMHEAVTKVSSAVKIRQGSSVDTISVDNLKPSII